MRNVATLVAPQAPIAKFSESIPTRSSPWRKLAELASAYAEEFQKAKIAEHEFARRRNMTAEREIRSGAIASAIKDRLY